MNCRKGFFERVDMMWGNAAQQPCGGMYPSGGRDNFCSDNPFWRCRADCVKNGGIQLQLNGASGLLIKNGRRVLFDRIINQTDPGITYDRQSGELILPEGKSCFVSWWVAVNGTEFSPGVEFAVTINGRPFSSGAAPQVTTQLSGAALVTARGEAERLALVNESGNTVRFAPLSVQAGIVLAGLG